MRSLRRALPGEMPLDARAARPVLAQPVKMYSAGRVYLNVPPV